MPWQDDPIVQASQPWKSDPIVQYGDQGGIYHAIVSGYQSSATGLMFRGRLPDVVLDHQHSKWYERALESVSGTVSELPEMIVGGVGGAVAGTAVAPGPGTLVGAGAGALALPAAIRESLIQAYSKGEVTSAADFLSRTGIVLKETGKAAVVGGLTAGAGGVAARTTGAALAPAIGETLGVGTARAAISAAQTTAELGTMTVVPSALEGKLPEPEDFVNAAITIGGMKSAGMISGRIADIFRRTGIPPEQIATDAARDPVLKEELKREWTGAPTLEEIKASLPPLEFKQIPDAELAARMRARADDVHRRTLEDPVELERIAKETGITPEAMRERLTKALNEPPPPKGDSVPAAYQPVATMEFLRNSIPEPPKVQQVIDNPAGLIPTDKAPNHINYDFSWEAHDVLTLRSSIAETFKQEIEAARGKESWDATQEKAQQYVRNWQAKVGPDQKAAAAKLSFSDVASQAMAVQAMADKAAFDAREAATRILKLGDQAKPEDIARQYKAIETAAWLHAIDQGNGAEIARAQNARKAFAQRKEMVEGWGQMLSQYGADHKALAQMITGIGSTEGMAKFASKLTKATVYEKFVEAWKAGILSGPVTHMANLMGNSTFLAMRPMVDLVSAAMGKAISAEERVSFAEPMLRVIGNYQGFKQALQFAGEALRTAYDEDGIRGVFKKMVIPTDTGKSEQFRQAIGGTKGHIIRLPFRALELADDLFRIANEQGELHTLAGRQAIKEGFDISSREFRERMMELVENPTDKMTEASEAAGRRFTFNQPLGEAGRAMQNLVTKAHLQLVVPFVRTPANIFKEMTRMTPLAPLVKDWRVAVEAGGTERAKAFAEMALGTTLGGLAASYVLEGNMTGQGNPDPDKRRTDELAGKQPYSIKIGNRWYSYQRIQPIGTLIGMAADLAEVADYMTDEEHNRALTMIGTAFANAVTQQTFLQGITNVVNAFSDPQRWAPRLVEQYAASMVPAAISQPTQAFDPVQREVHGLREAVEARIPGLREKLEPGVNPLTGEPLAAKEKLGGMSPINVSDISEDKVLLEAARLGVGVKKAPKSIELPSAGLKGLGKVELTPEQQTLFSTTAGHIAYQALSSVVASPTWDMMPPILQKKVFERAITQSRKIASMTAISPEQRMEKAEEIAAKISQQLSQ